MLSAVKFCVSGVSPYVNHNQQLAALCALQLEFSFFFLPTRFEQRFHERPDVN
jgi:hypothetical protein